MSQITALSDSDRIRRLVPPRTGRIQAVLDTDTYNEVDDQFALVHLLLSPGRIDLQAVYAAPFHNARSSGPGDGMRQSLEEIRRVFDRLGPLDHTPDYPPALEGADAWLARPDAPVSSPAAEDLVQRAMQRPADGPPLYVLAIGAPTNVASALLIEPAIAGRIVVVWLGGQPLDWPTAEEFNLRQDLHASRVLLDSGVPLVLVPCLQIAEQLRTTDAELAAHLDGRSRIATYLYQTVRDYQPWDAGSSKAIWDVAVTGWAVNPDWCASHLVPSPILHDDLTWGRHHGRHLIRVAHRVTRDAIFRDLFAKLATAGG